MKIVRVDNGNAISLMADSARRPDRRPYFVPEGAAPVCEIRPALRIDRLGKAISARFAGRYIGAWTPVCYTRPADDYHGMAPSGMLDDSLVTGRWMPLPQDSVTLCFGEDTATWSFDADAAALLLAGLSASATFKTGDIIVLPHTLFSFIPQTGTSVELTTVGGDKVLEFNIR